jgi:hypothetical protein
MRVVRSAIIQIADVLGREACVARGNIVKIVTSFRDPMYLFSGWMHL